MQYFEILIQEEKKARLAPLCPACSGNKNSGEHAQIVCWDCWRHPVHPYKYHNGTLSEWLTLIKNLN